MARVGWYLANSEGKSQPLASFDANNFDLYDMHGNVWEWCLDRWFETTYQHRPGNTVEPICMIEADGESNNELEMQRNVAVLLARLEIETKLRVEDVETLHWLRNNHASHPTIPSAIQSAIQAGEWPQDHEELDDNILEHYKINLKRPGGFRCVKRGGSWISPHLQCRSSSRIGDWSGGRDSYGGFRLALVHE